MAFGATKGTLTGGSNSIPASFATSAGSIAVQTGDLIIVVVGQQTTLTFGGTSGGGGTTVPTDNLGNTYVFQNNGTDAGAATGRMAYSRVTVNGTLTTVTCTCIGSTNDGSLSVLVVEGPFATSPLDAAVANVSNDTTTPYTGTATGTLTQADEYVSSWYAKDGNNTWTGSGSNVLRVNQNQSANMVTGIGGYVVSATTTQSPAWTGTAPTSDVLGTAAFKRDNTVALGGDRVGYEPVDRQPPRPRLKAAAAAATGLFFVALPPPEAPAEITQFETVQAAPLKQPQVQKTALQGESIFGFYSPWQDIGFENQSPQSYRTKYERAAALEGGDGIEVIKVISGPQLADSDYPAQQYLFPQRRPRYERGALRGKSSFGFFTNWYDYGFHVQPWQPPHQFKERRGAFLEGDDGIQAAYIFTVVTPKVFEPVLPTLRINPAGRRSAIYGDSQFVPFADMQWGWFVQPWQASIVQRNRQRAGMFEGDDGNYVQTAPPAAAPVTFETTPSVLKVYRGQRGALRGESAFGFFSPWKDIGFHVQPWQPPHRKPERGAAILEGDDGIQGVKPFLATASFPWNETPWVYPRHRWVGNFLKGDDGIQAVFSFVAFQPKQFESINVQLPHTFKEKRGAFLEGDDGTQAPFVPPAVFRFTEHTPILQPVKRPKFERGALRGESMFGFFSAFKTWHEVNSPILSTKRKTTLVGDYPLRFIPPQVVPLNFYQDRTQVEVRPRRKLAMIGETGPVDKFVFVAAPFTPFIGDPVPTLRLSLANRKFAIFGRADYLPFLDAIWGWENQAIQPPRLRVERRHGIGGQFGFLPFEGSTWGWDANVAWQPPSTLLRRDRLGAVAGPVFTPDVFTFAAQPVRWFETQQVVYRRRDKLGALFGPVFPPNVFVFTAPTPRWFETQYVHYRRKVERAGALAEGDGGIDDRYRRFFGLGFAVQPWQPPHKNNENKFGALAYGDDGIDRPFQRFFNYGWYVQPWQPPHRGTEHKAGAVMLGDPGHWDRLRRWFNMGWEVQHVQPPTHRYWLAGAIIVPVFIENLFQHVPPPPIIPPRRPTVKGPLWTEQPERQNVAEAGRRNTSDDVRPNDPMPRRYKDRS